MVIWYYGARIRLLVSDKVFDKMLEFENNNKKVKDEDKTTEVEDEDEEECRQQKVGYILFICLHPPSISMKIHRV